MVEKLIEIRLSCFTCDCDVTRGPFGIPEQTTHSFTVDLLQTSTVATVLTVAVSERADFYVVCR